MFDQLESRRGEYGAGLNTDQAELRAVELGTAPVDTGLDDDKLASTLDLVEVVEVGEVADWAVRDARLDDLTRQMGDELQRRARLLKSVYPFKTDGASLRYASTRTLVYELCLVISLAPGKQGKALQAMSRTFERIAALALECFLGERAASYRTGYSGDDAEDRPSLFRDVADELAAIFQTGEWLWSPAEGVPANPSQKVVKDLGIDFVAWKTFDDHRKGNLVVLGACACGGNWETKLGDIKIERLKGHWFRCLTMPDPLKAFAIPYHIPNDRHFEEVILSETLVLDRSRLTLLAESCSTHPGWIKLRPEIEAVIKATLPQFRRLEAA